MESFEPPLYIRYLLRLLLVSFTCLLAVGIPCFESIISLLGSGTVSVITYVLPPLLHMLLVTGRAIDGTSLHNFDGDMFSPKFQRICDIVLFCFGLSFCIVATSITALTVVDQLNSGGQTC